MLRSGYIKTYRCVPSSPSCDVIPSERSALSSVRWLDDPRTPDFMLKALGAVECSGLTGEV
jgi:hypothetical protein